MKANQTLLELSSRDIDSNQKSITSYLKVIQRLRKFPFFSVLQGNGSWKDFQAVEDDCLEGIQKDDSETWCRDKT